MFTTGRLIHLFSWSGLIDANILLSDLFKVPNLQTGRMEPLITALSPEEEEMATNMMRRLNTIFSVSRPHHNLLRQSERTSSIRSAQGTAGPMGDR